jgi:hypothetical protein
MQSDRKMIDEKEKSFSPLERGILDMKTEMPLQIS